MKEERKLLGYRVKDVAWGACWNCDASSWRLCTPGRRPRVTMMSRDKAVFELDALRARLPHLREKFRLVRVYAKPKAKPAERKSLGQIAYEVFRRKFALDGWDTVSQERREDEHVAALAVAEEFAARLKKRVPYAIAVHERIDELLAEAKGGK